MYLATGAAGTLVAHLPEIVLLGAFEDTLLGNVLLPEAIGLGIHLKTFLLVAAKDGNIETVLVNLHHLGEELPAVGNSLTLEVVAKRPIAEHLEHSMVVGIVAHLFEVVVLATDTQALLRVTYSRVLCRTVAKEDVLELVHSGIGEHQRRVVLDYHWG